MNIITIDPSLSCTAVCINGRFYVYTTNALAKTKKGNLNKWFEVMDQYVDYRFFDGIDKKLPYSQSELAKLKLYDTITDHIISDIGLNLDNDMEENLVCIEGYSYSSAAGPLIDLVTFSTLLRVKIMLDIGYHGVVVSPSTLKVKACELTYPEQFNTKGKKLPCKNCAGTSGGRFKKHEIMLSLLENEDLKDDWYVNLLKNECVDAYEMSKIPKPIEDINDAKIMYEIIIKLAKENDYNFELIESALLN